MPSTIGLQNEGAQRAGARAPEPPERACIDPEGNLIIPAALVAKLGLQPSDGLLLERTTRGLQASTDSLRKVYVEATGLCNLGCQSCVRQTWTDAGEHMPIERYVRLLAGLPEREPGQAPGRLTLSFGGFGEPLLHPQFSQMVALARWAGHRVEIITNGTLLTPERSAELLSQGVAQVTVSLDGGDALSYAGVRRTALDPVLANLHALVDARRRTRTPLRVGLAFVAMRRNIDSLPGLLALARELGVDTLSISNLVPHTEEMAREALWGTAAWQSGFAPASWGPRIVLGRIDVNENTTGPLSALWQSTAVAPSWSVGGQDGDAENVRCRFVHEGTLAVAWDGRVAPCLSLLHSHPEYVNGQLKQVVSYTVGHVDRHPLADIWQQPEYRQFRRRLRAFDFPSCFVCGGCPSTESNEEDCYGSPFPVCGECLWAHGIVLCP